MSIFHIPQNSCVDVSDGKHLHLTMENFSSSLEKEFNAWKEGKVDGSKFFVRVGKCEKFWKPISAVDFFLSTNGTGTFFLESPSLGGEIIKADNVFDLFEFVGTFAF